MNDELLNGINNLVSEATKDTAENVAKEVENPTPTPTATPNVESKPQPTAPVVKEQPESTPSAETKVEKEPTMAELTGLPIQEQKSNTQVVNPEKPVNEDELSNFGENNVKKN